MCASAVHGDHGAERNFQKKSYGDQPGGEVLTKKPALAGLAGLDVFGRMKAPNLEDPTSNLFF